MGSDGKALEDPAAAVVDDDHLQARAQRDRRGDFLLVVGADGTVEQRYVTLGQQEGTDVEISEGLAEGETAIVEGLQKVRPGVAVEPVTAGAPAE